MLTVCLSDGSVRYRRDTVQGGCGGFDKSTFPG